MEGSDGCSSTQFFFISSHRVPINASSLPPVRLSCWAHIVTAPLYTKSR